MNRRTDSRHSIDIIFLVVIFLVFTFSALSALLLSVNFYQNTVEKSERNEAARAAVAYIREVVHQNDEAGAVSLAEFDGIPCMKIRQGEDYCLYLYLKDCELRELYTKEGANVSASDGQKLLELKMLTFEETETGCYRIVCEDFFGNRETVLISSKTSGGQQP